MHSDDPSPALELTHRPDLGVLVGRWGYQPALTELPALYQQLQSTALQHGCRFWLQDIRRRTSNDPQTTDWLLSTYFPDVARHLGGRLYVAYLVGPALQQSILKRPGFTPTPTDDDKSFRTTLFGDEGEAMQWLVSQQARP